MTASRYILVALLYLIVGIGVYARIIGSFFVSDDFNYLELISTASSPFVAFLPLAERYFRPLVVLVYYVNYRMFGMSPESYHLSVVFMNAINAWLVFLLGLRLLPAGGWLAAAAAGLLFLVFGGHAEAITWIAGMADPLVTMFLLTALLFFLRALDADRPALPIAASWLALALAMLSKESAAIFPGLAVAAGLTAAPRLFTRARAQRAAIQLAGSLLILAGYFILRDYVLGTPLVNLQGLGTSTNLLGTTRAFVLRSFLSHGPLLTLIWERKLDVILVPAALALVAWRGRARAPDLALLAMCFFIALAPVLPLSIAIASTESERFIYLPSAFASLLVVAFGEAVLRRRDVLLVAIAAWCMLNAAALNRSNAAWEASSRLVMGTTSTFAEILRTHYRPGTMVFLLNLPDNVRGAFVYRRGFHEALHLLAPDVKPAVDRTVFVTTTSVSDPEGGTVAAKVGPAAYRLGLQGARIQYGQPPPTPHYSFREWSPQGLVAEFTPAASGGLVVYLTNGAIQLAGTVP